MVRPCVARGFAELAVAPRASWPTTWNEFLPISMPITAIGALLVFGAPCQLSLLAGQEHGRTIPLTEVAAFAQGPSGCEIVLWPRTDPADVI